MSDIIQGSAEWKAIRLGRATASRIPDVVAKTKNGWGASRANYAAQLIAERLTGQPQDSYTNAAMQFGTEQEPFARAAYEFQTDTEVVQIGFVEHPKIKMAGASPDGLVGGAGLVEIKCPNTWTHLETVRGGTIPAKYITQMQFQMACAGRQWCDFVSFDPRLLERFSEKRLFVRRITRDNKMIAELEKEVAAFLAEIEAEIALFEKTTTKREAA